MNFLDRFGLGYEQMLRTTFELRAAVIIDGQVLRVEIRSHRAVKDDDAFFKCVEKAAHIRLSCQKPARQQGLACPACPP